MTPLDMVIKYEDNNLSIHISYVVQYFFLEWASIFLKIMMFNVHKTSQSLTKYHKIILNTTLYPHVKLNIIL